MNTLLSPKLPLSLLALSLLAQAFIFMLYLSDGNDNFFLIFIRYYTSLAFMVFTFCNLIWIAVIFKGWIRKATSLVLIVTFGYFAFIWYWMGFLMLPYQTGPILLSPDKHYKAIGYSTGFIDVFPSLVIEGLGTFPRTIYEGAENTKLKYRWLDNKTIELKLLNQDSAYSGPIKTLRLPIDKARSITNIGTER